jgi:hypothetical protein
MGLKEDWNKVSEDFNKGKNQYQESLRPDTMVELNSASSPAFKSTWHGFHCLMTLLTMSIGFPFWILIWAWCGLNNSQINKRNGY